MTSPAPSPSSPSLSSATAAAFLLRGANNSSGITSGGLDSTATQALLKQQEDQLRATRLFLQQRQIDSLIASGSNPASRSSSILSHSFGGVSGLDGLLAASASRSNPSSRSNSILANGATAGLLSLSAAAAGQDPLTALAARRASASATARAMEAAASKVAEEEAEAEEDDGIEDEDYFKDYAMKAANEDGSSEGNLADSDDGKAGNESFPHKLYRMLFEADKDGLGHIVSFLPSGRGFTIHRPKDFVSEVMPRFFTTRRIASFQRQLNLYGFRRISEGREKGGYFHKDFMKGQRNRISRIKRKSTTARPTSAAFANRFGPSAMQFPGAALTNSLYGPGLLAGPSNASKELLLARFGSGSASAAASLLDLTRPGFMAGSGAPLSMGATHQDILRNAAASLLWKNSSNGGAF